MRISILTMNLLKARVTLLGSADKNLVGRTIFALEQEYPPPGAVRVWFLGNCTVSFVVPAFPTEIWNPAVDFRASWSWVNRTPPLQQPATCSVKGTPAFRSTTVGLRTQEAGVLPLNDEQSPRCRDCAPIVAQMTSLRAHVHPSLQPGSITVRYRW